MPVPNDPTLQAALDGLIAKTRSTRGVLDSVLVWVQGQAARMQAALDASEALGATVEELAPVQAEVDGAEAVAQQVAGAIAANP